MLDTIDILNQEGKRGVEIVVKSITPYRATSRTEQSVYYKIEGKETKVDLSIFARDYIEVLQSGSKPAKTKKPSKAMLAEMAPWAKVRGIPDAKLYAVAVVLLRDGQKVKRDLWDSKLDNWADEVADRITKEMAGYVVETIVKTFNK